MQVFFQGLRTQDVAIFFTEVAVFHVEVELGNCQQVLLGSFFYLHA